MNFATMLPALMGGNPEAIAGLLPKIACGPCIAERGPDAATASTIVAGTLVCDEHAGAELARVARDSSALLSMAYSGAVVAQSADYYHGADQPLGHGVEHVGGIARCECGWSGAIGAHQNHVLDVLRADLTAPAVTA